MLPLDGWRGKRGKNAIPASGPKKQKLPKLDILPHCFLSSMMITQTEICIRALIQPARPKGKFFFLFFLLISIFAESHSAQNAADRYFNQADIDILSYNYDSAISNYWKGINYAKPKDIPFVWDDLGFAFLQKKEISKALPYLELALQSFPENFNVQFYMGLAYLLNNQVELASARLNEVEKNIYFNESWIEKTGHLQLNNIYGDPMTRHEIDRLGREKGIYIKIIEDNKGTIYPDAFLKMNEGVFYFVQGLTYRKLGDIEKAEEKHQAALKSGFNEQSISQQLALLKSKESINLKDQEPDRETQTEFPTEILSSIQHGLQGHNNEILWKLHTLSFEEIKAGNWLKAIQTLERALLVDEQSFVVNSNLALLYFDDASLEGFNAKKLEKAEAYCAKGLYFAKYQTSDKEAIAGCHDLMGNIYYRQEKYEKARNEFEEILSLDPTNASAHYNLGVIYFHQENNLQAEQEWQKSVLYERKSEKNIQPKGPAGQSSKHFLIVKKKSILYQAHESLGDLYLIQDGFDKAIKEYEEAIQLRPEEANPYFNLAKAYLEKKDREKAIACLEKYLYLGGKNRDEAQKLLDFYK
jgi:tetratricopeptide (TPR) repeat protein